MARVTHLLTLDRDWYIKLTVDSDADGKLVLVISCHPVERPLMTRLGAIEP